MLLSTPGFVLHTTPYGDTSVVARVFTRQLGVQGYIIKGVRTHAARVKQNLLQPLSCLDMVVYHTPRNSLNHIKEISPHGLEPEPGAVRNALRFFCAEVLGKCLPDAEPLPALWDSLEAMTTGGWNVESSQLPVVFMLTLASHLGLEPLDNQSAAEPLFDLQEGRYVGIPAETTLPRELSDTLHTYLAALHSGQTAELPGHVRRDMLDALIAYFQLHLSGFGHIVSHEILHTVLH